VDDNTSASPGANGTGQGSTASASSYCNWDDIYSRFTEEMAMFHNIVHLVKHTPERELPAISGVAPRQYLPLFKVLESIYDSIKRLEAPCRDTTAPGKSSEPINAGVEKYARSVGADLVGFTTLETDWVFPASPQWTYPQTPQPIRNSNVISLGMQMPSAILNMDHFPDPETLGAALHVYARLGEAVEKITAHVRSLGYEARGHHPYAGDFLYSAHAVKAGLGELGANGLVLTKRFGPRQRFAAITTNAPITVSGPSRLGVDGLCRMCMRCVDTCPTKALSPVKVDRGGISTWKLDNEKCWPYFAANNGCGLCLIVCPWNRKESWYHSLAARGVAMSGLFARILLALDNAFFWKRAGTNPRNRSMKPVDSPISYARMLEIFGRQPPGL